MAEGGSGSNKEIWLPYHVERLADPRKAQRGLDRRNVIFSPKGRCHIRLTNVRSSGRGTRDEILSRSSLKSATSAVTPYARRKGRLFSRIAQSERSTCSEEAHQG